MLRASGRVSSLQSLLGNACSSNILWLRRSTTSTNAPSRLIATYANTHMYASNTTSSSGAAAAAAAGPNDNNETDKVMRLLSKIQRLGKENKMATLSHLLSDEVKNRRIDELLDRSVVEAKKNGFNHRHTNISARNSKYIATEASRNALPAMYYIVQSFVKERSPCIIRLLELLDRDIEVMSAFSYKSLLMATGYLAAHIRLALKIEGYQNDLRLTFFDKLIVKEDKKICANYISKLNLPPKVLRDALSVQLPYEMSFLHMHITTKHLAKWSYAAYLDDSEIPEEVIAFLENTTAISKCDPIMASTLLMYNLRATIPLSDTLINKFCSAIFFATCAFMFRAGGSINDAQRLLDIVKQNKYVDFEKELSFDGYRFALKSLFGGYAAKNGVGVINDCKPLLALERWPEVNFMVSFMPNNTIAASKLRFIFLQMAVKYSYDDVASTVIDNMSNNGLLLGTSTLNMYIRRLASIGEFDSIGRYIELASAEKQSKRISDIAVGVDRSTVSTFMVGVETFFAAKDAPAESPLSSSFPSQIELQSVYVILKNLLDRIIEYKLAPALELLQRVLNFNDIYLRDSRLTLKCVELALSEHCLLSQTATLEENPASVLPLGTFDHQKWNSFPTFDPNSKESGDQLKSVGRGGIEAKKFFSDAVQQLCYPNCSHLTLYLTISDILSKGFKFDAAPLNFVFEHLITIEKYNLVIDLFEMLSQHELSRTLEQATAVIEALAKMNRFKDCWRSIKTLEPVISLTIVNNSTFNELQLFQRTNFLAVFASQGLKQLALKSKDEDSDTGIVKMSNDELLAAIIYCIDKVLKTDPSIEWNLSANNSQDLIVLQLCQFKFDAEHAVVSAVFGKISSVSDKAAELIKYVMSVEREMLDATQ